jgi:hypothetical protein
MLKGVVVANKVFIEGVFLGDVLLKSLLPCHLVVMQLVQPSLVDAAVMPTLESVANPGQCVKSDMLG